MAGGLGENGAAHISKTNGDLRRPHSFRSRLNCSQANSSLEYGIAVVGIVFAPFVNTMQRRSPTLKHLRFGLLIVCLLLSVGGAALSVPQTAKPRATNDEEKEARDLAMRFTILFTETQDLTPIVKEFYFRDFVERYKAFKTKGLDNKRVDVYFAPGIEYNSQLLTAADSKVWEAFYVATNNLLLLGFISALKGSADESSNIRALDLYPSEVLELLHTNPTLANMIVKDGPAKAVGTVEEMRAATATLTQAVTMIREKHKGNPPQITNKNELARVIRQDDFFKPRVEVLDQSFFSFPKNTRILFMKTPLGLQLMLAKDADRLRIFWTEIIAQ